MIDKVDSPSAEDCQDQCQNSEHCEFWSYTSNEKTCRTQTKEAQEVEWPCDVCTRGPKYCPGKLTYL